MGNACGIIGLLHALGSINSEIKFGKFFKNLIILSFLGCIIDLISFNLCSLLLSIKYLLYSIFWDFVSFSDFPIFFQVFVIWFIFILFIMNFLKKTLSFYAFEMLGG